MTATYTFDILSSLDGYGSHHGDWGGYWGKQGPELLERRLALYDEQQRMVFGANTYREFAQMVASSTEDSDVWDATHSPLMALCLRVGRACKSKGSNDARTADRLHHVA